MKIAIPSEEKTMVSEHFGRTKYFVIYDTETQTQEVIDNSENVNAAQGAGIQTAVSLVNAGIAAVLSPKIGPKAFDQLKNGNIEMFHITEFPCSVVEAMQLYKEGKLAKMESFVK
jgi:predicted Fe-Mo cluster-binding NifX family protein